MRYLRSYAPLFSALLALSIGIGWALTPLESERVALVRSPALSLTDVASLTTTLPQVGWAMGPAGVGWGRVDVPDPEPDLDALSGRGRELAQQRCAPCHGTDGRGGGALDEFLPRHSRDLSGPLRSRRSTGAVTPDEVFRTVTAGAPRYGMPSFAHLPELDRWALVSWVLNRQAGESHRLGAAAASGWVELPARPASADLHLGQDVYRARCASCHGPEGEGGVMRGLADVRGDPCPPTVFAAGPNEFRTGSRPEDVARTLVTGRPGTPMIPVELEPAQLWAVADYVSRLAELGWRRRRLAWNAYFDQQARLPVTNAELEDPPRRFKSRRSKRFAVAPDDAADGCLGCHEGLDAISEGPMARALAAVAGGDPNRECVVCHEGNSGARTKAEAHAGFAGNPGSLWVTSLGAGCAKCHSAPGSLTTLMGAPLPEAVGGRLMHATSALSDPSRATSGNYTYRMQRALMAQETGKVLLVTSSVGLPDAKTMSDFPLADPDGPVPCVGTGAYKGWIAGAIERGYIERLERTRGVPTFAEAVAQVGGNKARASVVDYARKACFRCHVWGEGQATRGEHRSAGCSACHIDYGPNGFSYSDDPTIPPRTAGHAEAHRIVATPSNAQCNHCHTRNPLTAGTEPHELAGLGCVDCHTSIDVHGDGNAYPHMEHQVEVRCQDCHGAGSVRPWDLPLGHGTPAAEQGARGVYDAGSRTHLLSNRGNPRSNWLREGDQVVIESFLTGARHTVPPPRVRDHPEREGCAQDVPGHDALSCSLCHNRSGPRCGSCHMTYVSHELDRDWLLSAYFYDPKTARQGNVLTPGHVRFKASDEEGVPFGEPDTRVDRAGRLVPREAGCRVIADYMEPDGKLTRFEPRFNAGSESYPPPVANTLPHENALPPRGCAECHPEGTGKGKPARLFGHVQHR